MSSPDEPPGGHEAPAWGAERYSPSSYAYKPPWAQPHYPLIPAQRTGPPARLGRPAEPPPAHSARRWWLLAGVTALLVAVLLGVVAQLWTDRSLASPAPGAVSEPPNGSTQSMPATRAALDRNGARALAAMVNGDLDAASGAAGPVDRSATQPAGRSPRGDVERAQPVGLCPDPEPAARGSAAPAEFARAAPDRVSGATVNSGALERTTTPIKTINGN